MEVFLELTGVNADCADGAVEVLLRGPSPSLFKETTGLCGVAGSAASSPWSSSLNLINLLCAISLGCVIPPPSLKRLPNCLCVVSNSVAYSCSPPSPSLAVLCGDPPATFHPLQLSVYLFATFARSTEYPFANLNFRLMLCRTWLAMSHAFGSSLELNALDGSIFGKWWQYIANAVRILDHGLH